MATFSIDPHKLEELLNYCTGFAKQMVQAHGEFHPFGAVIAANGQLTAVGGYNGDEHPRGPEIYNLLQDSMKVQFGKREIVAGAIAVNVDIPVQFEPPFPDGIRVLLECSGFSRFIYLPYRISGGRVDYGEFISVEVRPTISMGNGDAAPDGA
jgi:hypothetical protein